MSEGCVITCCVTTADSVPPQAVFLIPDYLVIVMELADLGNLYDFIAKQPSNRLSEENARCGL